MGLFIVIIGFYVRDKCQIGEVLSAHQIFTHTALEGTVAPFKLTPDRFVTNPCKLYCGSLSIRRCFADPLIFKTFQNTARISPSMPTTTSPSLTALAGSNFRLSALFKAKDNLCVNITTSRHLSPFAAGSCTNSRFHRDLQTRKGVRRRKGEDSFTASKCEGVKLFLYAASDER